MPGPDMNEANFSLPITYDMTPKSRLNVFYIRPDGEVVTDAITFNVDGIFKNKVKSTIWFTLLFMNYKLKLHVSFVYWFISEFLLISMYFFQVSINFDRRQVQPGNEVILSLKADPHSLVNVLAVDKSVLLLKSGNDLSQDEVSLM